MVLTFVSRPLVTGHKVRVEQVPSLKAALIERSAGLSQEGSWKATSGALLDTELSSG